MPKTSTGFSLAIEYYREGDGRWLVDIPTLPGVTAYGRTRRQATAAVQALALGLSRTGWSMARPFQVP
jgi:predicted RNase H-like HicB family nuclease